MLHTIAGVLYRRVAPDDKTPEVELPAWSWPVILLNLVVFLPVLLYTAYTIKHIYPVLAIVEDENPPAYDPVPSDEAAAAHAAAGADGDGLTPLTEGKARPVTSSLRSTVRALHAAGGWRASLRGFTCFLAQALAQGALVGFFSAFLPAPLASLAALPAQLALVQLSAAWVHIVLSPPSPRHFYQRLPPFRRAFDATARPVALAWLAQAVAGWVALAVAYAIGMPVPGWTAGRGGRPVVPDPQDPAAAAWKPLVVVLVSVALNVLLVLPAHVVLVRVQASLLPGEDDTIVPFDRSFEGKVEPVVVGGKGYVSMADAWRTFRRSAWKRLIVLYVKLYLLSFAIYTVLAVVIVPQVHAMIKHGHRKDGN